MARALPSITVSRVALTPLEKKIMKEFQVGASAARKAAAEFKKLETKTQKTKPNSLYSFDQKGKNYGKATKNLLKNQ
jgi:hypothetical protein